MNEWLLILGMMLVTFGVRYPVMLLVGKLPMSDRVVRALRYVPPAVLAAIIVPSMLYPDGQTFDLSLQNSYLVAGVVGVILAWRTRNLLLTIVLGMGFFLLYRAVFGLI
ncbi:MAG: AzlD domain-containing protein [Anaerolineae bacterium]|nr:AzlD domain-containing protein [Anaerolineae bacterium]NUQ06949.1 AzlD domain-containing protein [Anaerolineae bacterium]